MSDARKFAFRVAPAVAMFAFCGLVQPAAAQFKDTVAITITDAAEGAVSPGCPKSFLSSANPWRLPYGMLPASDYSCFEKEKDVRGIAAYYAPYALQAALAYEAITDDQSGDTSLDAVVKKKFEGRVGRVTKLLRDRGWRFEAPDRCLLNGSCGSDYKVDKKGLAYHLWSRKTAGGCREAAIAFRGSVGSVNAWGTNFQQYIPAWSSEYDSLNLDLVSILRNVRKLGCKYIVAVGHSLGGGLGQFAALAAPPEARIAKVVTFNTSPISGEDLFGPQDQARLAANKQGLTIDRVNQRGEILSYTVAKLVRQTRATKCNPLIRSVEFNAAPARSSIPLMSLYEQHEIVPFASRLVALSYPRDSDDVAGMDPVRSRLPPSGGQAACSPTYKDQQDEEFIADAPPNDDRRGAVGSGRLMGQQSQDMAVYASVPDRENAFAKLGGARVHKRIARQHGSRGAKLHLARF